LVGSEHARPRVSVCVTTYNHENYISQALDSVLNQQTDFEYEILVGEDDSSDRTRDIVREYAERYPGVIRPFFNDRANVIYINGMATGRWNFTNLLKHASRQYVALLEGDDFWTDGQKLQMQVDTLDANPGCSLCFHNAIVLDEATHERQAFTALDEDRIVEIDEVIRGWIVPTASIVFRRDMLVEFPDWYFEVISGDYGLQLLLADKGPFIYLNRNMSVYRKHAGNLSNRLGTQKFHRNLSWLYERFNDYTERKYERQIAAVLAKRYGWSADMNMPGIRNPFLALGDHFRSLKYANRTGLTESSRYSWQIGQWTARSARAALDKTRKWISALTSG
jgi:glycosyltransferase involved in cell wall biosynthesis